MISFVDGIQGAIFSLDLTMFCVAENFSESSLEGPGAAFFGSGPRCQALDEL